MSKKVTGGKTLDRITPVTPVLTLDDIKEATRPDALLYSAEQVEDSITEGINTWTNRAVVVANKTEADAYVKAHKSELKKGDAFLLTDTGTPDYWWTGTALVATETKVDTTFSGTSNNPATSKAILTAFKSGYTMEAGATMNAVITSGGAGGFRVRYSSVNEDNLTWYGYDWIGVKRNTTVNKLMYPTDLGSDTCATIATRGYVDGEISCIKCELDSFTLDQGLFNSNYPDTGGYQVGSDTSTNYVRYTASGICIMRPSGMTFLTLPEALCAAIECTMLATRGYVDSKISGGGGGGGDVSYPLCGDFTSLNHIWCNYTLDLGGACVTAIDNDTGWHTWLSGCGVSVSSHRIRNKVEMYPGELYFTGCSGSRCSHIGYLCSADDSTFWIATGPDGDGTNGKIKVASTQVSMFIGDKEYVSTVSGNELKFILKDTNS